MIGDVVRERIAAERRERGALLAAFEANNRLLVKLQADNVELMRQVSELRARR